jgi:selenide,water dikinase
LSPKVLDQVLAAIPRATNENVLVGYDTSDDAGVYRLTPELALVQTLDFFTPIVDDPHTYGAIAAANALSDVYAMGGKPLTALSILAYPGKGDLKVLEAILRGGAEKIHEAGAVILGGHSVNDDEIKFGYSVSGTVHPDRVLTNTGAHVGDAVVLTKRIGTGVIATALKQGFARESDVEASVESMLTLNRDACENMLHFAVHGCTDVTGFGLLGHAREMALGSKVSIEIEVDEVPLLPGALECAEKGALPGGLKNNREFVMACVTANREIAPELEALLYDPQTSGGLLITLPEEDAAELSVRFPAAVRIGRVTAAGTSPIRLL